jgi:4-oxalocrotonate tautomerase
MPHVIIKMHPGRTEEQKICLAETITKDVMEILLCEEKTVSVAIEEVSPTDWVEKVYRPDILGDEDRLYKKPGYNPLEGKEPPGLKDVFIQRLQTQFEEWKPEIDRLKSKAEQVTADAKSEYHKLIDDLQDKQKTARIKLDEIRQSSGGAWEDLKTGIEGAWKEMEKALKAAVSKFKPEKND